MRIDRLGRLVLTALLAFILPAVMASAQAPRRDDPGYRILAGKAGPVLNYTSADFSLSAEPTIPTTGWYRGPLPAFKLLQSARQAHIDPPTVWVRLHFDRARLGAQPIAIYGEMFRDNFVLYLNGAELYRTRADAGDPSFGWNRPLFAPLPPAMLRPGINEIAFRIETTKPHILGIGDVRVGGDHDIRSSFDTQLFLSNVAPQIISGYLLILTIGAISFWIRRPRDRVYGWIALVGVTWLFRNLHYFVQTPPFAADVFWALTTDSIFLLLAVVFGFAVSYFRLPRSRQLYAMLALCCGVEIAARHTLVAFDRSELPSFLLTIPQIIVMLAAILAECRHHPNPQYWRMLMAIAASVLFAFHDLAYSFNITPGAGFYLLPYGGLLIFATFDVALTSRLQTALIDVEDVNLKLEARVADVTESLAKSEAARAELQVAKAVGNERDRIMREIHDGIGSNLLTALAQARHRGDPADTIATLSRSLTDLRIAVDSLEPIGGDVVSLLANLRHRMERELKGAGVAFAWKVEDCPPLDWLDPIGALHVLRILQEAIGNVLAHSGARTIEVRARSRARDCVAGVQVEIIDNGRGFLSSVPSRGKGLANMAARAEAISAQWSCETSPGGGTAIALWLPVVQPAPKPAGQ